MNQPGDLDQDRIVARLRAAGCVFAEDEARLLRAAATGAELVRLVDRRADGTPLEYLLGWAEFAGRRVAVEPGVFVPRRRTALLVQETARRAKPAAVVVDLCCGTGAVAAAVLARRPDADVHAAELDPAAVRCARRNLEPARVHQGDLYAALPARLRGRIDVLAVNAPYVPTEAIALMPAEARDHEAQLALDGGPDGLDLHRRVCAGAPEWLAPDGWLLLETSAAQAAASAGLAVDAGLTAEIVTDDDIGATAVAAHVGPLI
jgi:release factor glutamine methyltransferase